LRCSGGPGPTLRILCGVCLELFVKPLFQQVFLHLARGVARQFGNNLQRIRLLTASKLSEKSGDVALTRGESKNARLEGRALVRSEAGLVTDLAANHIAQFVVPRAVFIRAPAGFIAIHHQIAIVLQLQFDAIDPAR
jgi:hypothetical protein